MKIIDVGLSVSARKHHPSSLLQQPIAQHNSYGFGSACNLIAPDGLVTLFIHNCAEMSDSLSNDGGAPVGFDLAETVRILASSSTSARVARLQFLDEAISHKGTSC